MPATKSITAQQREENKMRKDKALQHSRKGDASDRKILQCVGRVRRRASTDRMMNLIMKAAQAPAYNATPHRDSNKDFAQYCVYHPFE